VYGVPAEAFGASLRCAVKLRLWSLALPAVASQPHTVRNLAGSLNLVKVAVVSRAPWLYDLLTSVGAMQTDVLTANSGMPIARPTPPLSQLAHVFGSPSKTLHARKLAQFSRESQSASSMRVVQLRLASSR
jgi:hypothetical protein